MVPLNYEREKKNLKTRLLKTVKKKFRFVLYNIVKGPLARCREIAIIYILI